MDFTRRAMYGGDDERGGPWTDTMQVCLNGHTITDMVQKAPHLAKARCAKDGTETITDCLNCGRNIPGRIHYPNSIALTGPMKAPEYCEHCGKPFPWTQKSTPSKAAPHNAPQSDDLIYRLFIRFHIIADQLRHRYSNRPTLDVRDEHDVQDLLHALLRINFDDVRPEEWTPSYAGKSARIDFVLPTEETVIEVKHTRSTLTEKELGDELLIDIGRYRVYPNCKRLFCFVFDPLRHIKNPRGVEADLMKLTSPELEVRVIITPR
jgi:DpnII restriction endonuclease/uncharacterized protein DUF2321